MLILCHTGERGGTEGRRSLRVHEGKGRKKKINPSSSQFLEREKEGREKWFFPTFFL